MSAQNNSNQNNHNNETNSNRDEQGRFAQGNRGGPGNPFARQVAQLRKVILNALTPEEMLAITQKFIELAKEGNVQAAKLLMSYSLGKPTEGVQPDKLDVEEWEIQKGTALMSAETNLVALKPEADFTLNIVHNSRFGMSREAAKGLLEQFQKQDEAERRKEQKKRDRQRQKADGTAPVPATMTPETGQAAPSPNGFFEELIRMRKLIEEAERDEQSQLSVM